MRALGSVRRATLPNYIMHSRWSHLEKRRGGAVVDKFCVFQSTIHAHMHCVVLNLHFRLSAFGWLVSDGTGQQDWHLLVTLQVATCGLGGGVFEAGSICDAELALSHGLMHLGFLSWGFEHDVHP